MIEGWMSLTEAASRFGVERDRLKRASLRGGLATVRLNDDGGGCLLVRPEEVERYLRETRRGRPAKVRETE